MRFFELHFNPQKGDSLDSVFDSFCYEPENVYEKRLGSLLIMSQLKNVLPQNLKFLDNLAAEIKKRYYSSPTKFSAEAALKNCLKKTNEFLEEIVKNGEVSWLGNLDLAVFNIKSEKKGKFEVNFTKVGDVKILLIRPGQIVDIGKNLEFSEIEPYPLKIFGNIVTGKLVKDDLVIALTKDVFEHFSEQGLLKEIAKINPGQDFAQGLKMALKNREKELLKISGICLISLLTKEGWNDKRPKTSFIFEKEAEKFSLKKAFFSVLRPLTSAYKKIFKLSQRKNLILVLLVLFLLLLGFLIFR